MSDGKITLHIDAAHKREDIAEYDPFNCCPKCGGETQVGFGLAGGGYGAYTFCEACGEVVTKTEEADNG